MCGLAWTRLSTVHLVSGVLCIGEPGHVSVPCIKCHSLQVSLDTSQYRPDELRVSVNDNMITIEGKHEEKSEDGHKMVAR